MPESTNSTLVPSQLKVVELRKELADRDLSTKGLKKELVARLEEALKAEAAGSEGNASEESSKEEPKEEEKEEKQPEGPKEAEVAEKTNEKEEKAKVEKETEDDETVKPAEEKQETEKPATTETAAESPKEVQNGKQETAVEPQEEMAEIKEDDSTAKPSESQSTEEPGTGAKIQEDKTAEEKVEEKASNGSEDITDRKRKAETEPEESSKNLKVESPTAPVTTATEDSPKADEASGATEIYIKNLVRPLMVRQVEELLNKYGQTKEVWVNWMKSRCYARFNTPQQAKEACAQIDGKVFPEGTGRELKCGFLRNNEMVDLIEVEEKARQDGSAIDLVDDGKTVKLVNTKGAAKGNGNPKKAPTPTTFVPTLDHNAPDVPIDELFKKTETKPHLYYRPLTDEEVEARKAEKQKEV